MTQTYEEKLAKSREAKQRASGTCLDCGAETRYHGHGKRVSDRCLACAAKKNGLRRRGRGPVMEKVLKMLEDEGPLRYSEIRQRLGTSNGHTSQLIWRLYHHGLVVRVKRGVYAKANGI